MGNFKPSLKKEDMWIITKSGIAVLTASVNKLFQGSFVKPSDPKMKQTNFISLRNKNAVISGEFFPMGEEVLRSKLVSAKVHVMPHISEETHILICGKFPDWDLINEARSRAIQIIFIDKASDLFSHTVPAEHVNPKNEPVHLQIPLGI